MLIALFIFSFRLFHLGNISKLCLSKGETHFCFRVRKKINCCLAKKRRRGQLAFHPRRRNESEDCARACGRAGVRVGGLHAGGLHTGGRASKLRARTTSTVSSRSNALFQRRNQRSPYGQMWEGDWILRPGSPLVSTYGAFWVSPSDWRRRILSSIDLFKEYT